MKSGVKRVSSRKQPKDPRQGRGRKGLEESEKQLTGAGWTTAATTHFMELETDEQRLSHTCAMFSISDEDYNYKLRSTYLVDFNFGNGMWCIEQKYDISKTQFVCRSLSQLLESVIYTAQQEETPDFDLFKEQLLDKFQTAFFDFNAEEYKITPEETKDILNYIGMVIITPIRLIFRTYKQEPYVMNVLELKKVFAPPRPDPLDQCIEQFPLPSPEEEFIPPIVPRAETLVLADVREALAKYTDSIIAAIDQRYNKMEEMVGKITQNV